MNNKNDIFDDLADDVQDPFADVETTEELAVKEIRKSISDLFKKIELKEQRHNEIVAEIKDLVRSEIAKIKPVQNVIERQVEQIIRHEQDHFIHHTQADLPPQKEIVREILVEIPKNETKVYVEQSALDAALKKISDLEKELEETSRIARTPMVIPFHGGPGVIGIPPPEAATVADVLTVNADKKAEWKTPTAGSGSVTPSGDTYTVSNLTKDFNFDATDTTVDELAAVLGSLIDSCRTSGIVL